MLYNERTRKTQPKPTTYAEAVSVLAGRDSRKIAHNTRLERLDAETIGVCLHSTVIVRFCADGRTILNTGGWQTVTTKERLNRYLPAGYRISATKFIWWLYFMGERVGEYRDGLEIVTRTAEQDA